LLKKGNKIFGIRSQEAFTEQALETFHFQYEQNAIYRRWVDLLKRKTGSVKELDHIPFMPVEFFRRFPVVTGTVGQTAVKFVSSSTTSQTPSIHYVNDISIYEESFLQGFRLFYGEPSDYCILALLPNYVRRGDSSLVYMFKKLMEVSGNPRNGFYLDNIDELIKTIETLKSQRVKTILIGVSYALLDLCTKGTELTEDFIVMETGGMKGTRKELLKPELHAILKEGFKVNEIHSEYGMTELLSQAYSKGDGLFTPPPWMRFLVREIDDPQKIRADHKTGGINVIDLANIHSCAFIATKDLGRLHAGGKLELMGRYNESDVRGCNLMIENY
jgi:phenylacetate-coenzyme A ligase PaaK-like adenylate-forming protein